MSKRLTTQEFIERATRVHGNEFDYSLVEYKTTDSKIKIICKIHGEFEQRPNNHLNGAKCIKCGYVNAKQTNLEKYGTEYTFQSENNKNKSKLTCLEKYGVENPAQSKDIYYKIKQTNLEKYGCESALGNVQIKNKKNCTMIDRYGTMYPTQNKNVKKKVKKTNIERYGYVNPMHNKDVKNKLIQTNTEKYGCNSPFGNKEVREKTKKTNLERYGVENPFSNKEIQEKIKVTNLNKHGVKSASQKKILDILPLIEDKKWLFEQYILQNKTATQIAYELNINNTTIGNYLKKHEIEIRYTVGYSMKCIQWLESIMSQEGIFIQHAGNIGEFKILGTRFKADGYCASNNTVYEFHGDCFHGNPDLFEEYETPNFYKPELTALELYNNTKERENKIINLGYNLVVIWENDYNKLL